MFFFIVSQNNDFLTSEMFFPGLIFSGSNDSP